MKDDSIRRRDAAPTGRADGRKRTGKLGEDAACAHLEAAGLTIVERNWRCRIGEIDIIASREGILHFIEVRTRRAGGRFGTAAESVDRRKQSKVTAAAQFYLRQAGVIQCRFDVVAITLDSQDAIVELNYLESAF
ncbi:YraN family protein [Paenibacillus sp. NEAU-GSW1]|uniref:YraN family protein n=1 Tax=Paenibacillus sp. NEAU-GSW1 TaxID=2682486 RepID=UPI0012E19092|nr:YraN family protein [Paenibacillus sp. NEAU-GSW1]MUT66336.1 YraN family protein [Paenibacillus sp. NEAU-GSW1]